MTREQVSVQLDLGHLALFAGQQINRQVRIELARHGYADVRDAHGYVFQHLIDGPPSISSLGQRMGITQQAASKRIAEMLALGYVEIDPASTGRTRLVAISAKGRALIETARALRARVHAQLQAELDPQALDAASRLLQQLLARLGGLEAVMQRRVHEPD